MSENTSDVLDAYQAVSPQPGGTAPPPAFKTWHQLSPPHPPLDVCGTRWEPAPNALIVKSKDCSGKVLGLWGCAMRP